MSFYPKPGFNHRVTTIILCRGKEVEACMITILRLCSFCFHPPQAHLQRNIYKSVYRRGKSQGIHKCKSQSHKSLQDLVHKPKGSQVYLNLIQIMLLDHLFSTQLNAFFFLVKPVSKKREKKQHYYCVIKLSLNSTFLQPFQAHCVLVDFF